MMEVFEELYSYIGDNFFKQAGLEFMREAWVASMVGSLSNSSQVRLVEAPEYDFEMRSGNVVTKFEVTEADLIDRRRGDEFSSNDTQTENDSYEQIMVRVNQAHEMLRSAAMKKTEKKEKYAFGCALVIYLNLGDYDLFQTEIEEQMETAIAPALAVFENTHVLWKNNLYTFPKVSLI